MSEPTRRRRIVGLRPIVTLLAAGLTAAGVLALGVFSERQSREQLGAELETRLLLTARNLAMMSSGALLSDYPELTLHPLIKEMQREQPSLVLVEVIDHDGIIQGHSDARQLGQAYQPPEAVSAGADRSLRDGEILGTGSTLILAEAPVLHPSGEPIGRAVVAMERSYVARLLAAARLEQLVVIGAILAVSLLAILLVMSHLLRPVKPLREGLERIGDGDLETSLPVTGRTEFSLLADTVNSMATRLRVAQADLVEKERLSHELELAREIQTGLLPDGDLAAGPLLLAGKHRAAAEVGGDYYDFLTLPDGRVAVAIADVSGKGLAGCLIMSMLSALWRSHAPRYDSPRELLLALDEQLSPMLKTGQFVTMFYGLLDPSSGRLRFASAAHSPLALRRANGEVEWRVTQAIPLGAVSTRALASTLREDELELGPGDLLLQYTDGVNEAFDAAGEQFGLTRIEECLRNHGEAGAASVLTALHDAVQDWTGEGAPSDDETLLAIGFEGATASTEPGAEWLARARRGGRHLQLPADLSALSTLSDWLSHCDAIAGLDAESRALVETAVYEAAANVAEHAYGLDARHHFDLWWVAPETGPTADGSGLAGGFFLLRDDGRNFDPASRPPSDFDQPEVRSRGRGLGLDIIRGVTRRFEYFPRTSAGNLTVLSFADAEHRTPEEITHV
jgi:sigma-B regulation protein RsbU (phosphoserine phosphatase)